MDERKEQNESMKWLRLCAQIILGWTLPIVLWFVFCLAEANDIPNLVRALVCTLCALLLSVQLCRLLRRRREHLEWGLAYHLEAYNAPPGDLILQAVLAEELDKLRSRGRKPVARRAVRQRLILSGIFILINFIMINFLYYRTAAIPLGSLLLLVYTPICFHCNTLTALCKAAKEEPDTPLTQIISRETFDDCETPKCHRLTAACILALALSLGGFTALHLQAGWSYSMSPSGYAITAYKPGLIPETHVQVPGELNGKPVTAIGDQAFANLGSMERVSIPGSVQSIGTEAFTNCARLQKVTLEEGLVHIRSGAFKNCTSLKTITLPQTLEKLNGEAFMGCLRLRSITIPEGVTEIRGNTFEGCSALQSVTLHDGILDIHAYAFRGCSSLEAIALPLQITQIHEATFENCSALKAIVIPEGVTKISAHAFYGCSSLSEVSVPSTVKIIGSSAFRLCDSLKQIRIPPDASVDARAFKDSPTKVTYAFTEEQRQKIQAELDSKTFGTMYYIYSTAEGPDVIFSPAGNGAVAIADSPFMKEKISASMALQPMHSYEEILAFLERVKAAGVTTVEYCSYSEVASAIRGSTYIIGNNWNIDELIAAYRQDMANAETE